METSYYPRVPRYAEDFALVGGPERTRTSNCWRVQPRLDLLSYLSELCGSFKLGIDKKKKKFIGWKDHATMFLL